MANKYILANKDIRQTRQTGKQKQANKDIQQANKDIQHFAESYVDWAM